MSAAKPIETLTLAAKCAYITRCYLGMNKIAAASRLIISRTGDDGQMQRLCQMLFGGLLFNLV
jgi:hypothetical protein